MSENKDNIEVVRTRLLNNRGIGSNYHYQSLSTYQHESSKDMLEFVKSYGPEDKELGLGASIVGKGSSAYDLAMLTFRGFVLRGLDTYVFQFAELVNSDGPILEAIHDRDFPSLGILNFNPESSRYDPKSYSLIEAFLQRNYLDKQTPLFIHFPVEAIDEKKFLSYGDLVSENFLEQVMKKSRKFDIN